MGHRRCQGSVAVMEYQLILHVTPRKNFHSIMDCGLLPEFATGKRKVTWFATPETLSWALAHISARKNLTVNDLMVFHHVADMQFLTRTSWKGVYVSSFAIRPSGVMDLEHFLSSPTNGTGD